jgi:hypothetical protein
VVRSGAHGRLIGIFAVILETPSRQSQFGVEGRKLIWRYAATFGTHNIQLQDFCRDTIAPGAFA